MEISVSSNNFIVDGIIIPMSSISDIVPKDGRKIYNVTYGNNPNTIELDYKTITNPVFATYADLGVWLNANIVTDFTTIITNTDKIPDILTETDKIPAEVVKTAAIKTETDKIPAEVIKTTAIKAATDKIEGAATLGLLGTNNSLAYRVHEIEKHFHNVERWYGKSADQSGANPWAKSISDTGMVTSYTAISGTANFGADANDEAFVWGLNDVMTMPIGDAPTKMDLHQMFITAASVTTIFYIRLVYGSGTMADAIAAGQFSTFPIVADAPQNGSIDVIIPVMMPRITIGTDKIWIQCKNATNNATISFLIGAHFYIA